MRPPVTRPSPETTALEPAGGRWHTAGSSTTVLIDPVDDPAWTTAALDAHSPAEGRISVHPTPSASHPPSLAQDVLTALGKRLPGRDPRAPRHHSSWADMVHAAWTAAASWVSAYRAGHLIVLRTHTLTPPRWAQLATLQRRTGIHLTLIWHARPDSRLTERTAQLGQPYQLIDDYDTALRRLSRHGTTYPGPTGDRWYTSPPARSWPTAPDLSGLLRQIGHPLHAGLLAAQSLNPDALPGQLAATQLRDLAPTAAALALPRTTQRWSRERTWRPVSAWARPLLQAARAWHYLTGHRHDTRRLFQHINFHHHNQLINVAQELGIHAAIEKLTGDPAWPTNNH